MARRVRVAFSFLLLTGVYVLAGKLGLALAVINPSASPVWPPTGIALAAALILGPRVWPAIFTGAFIVNYGTAAQLWPSSAIALGNTLEALIGATLVRRFANGRAAFFRSRDFFVFVVLAGFVSTAVSATIGTTSLALAGALEWARLPWVWLTWYLGNAAGNIIVAPLCVLWADRRQPLWTRRRAVELLVLAAGITVVGTIVFMRGSYPIEFLTIPVCVWAGARFGPREAATATALFAGMAIWAALHGSGPFASQPPNSALLLTQMLTVVAQFAGLGTGAAVAEMMSAEEMLRRLKDGLEGEVAARTAELRTSQARLAEAQEVAHIGSWEWDTRTGEFSWSDELFRLYGAAPGSFVPTAQTFAAMVHADDRARIEEIAKHAIAGGHAFEFEFRLLRADGVARIAVSRGRAIQDQNGHTVRLVGTMQDVTDQKQLDTRLRQTQKLESLGLLAGGIAHDFNNLITTIGGYTDLIFVELATDDPRREDLDEIRKAAQRAAALTQRLLAFSRTQSLQGETVDVNTVVAGLGTLLRRTIGEDIELTLALDPNLAAVRIERDQLEQVVLNIALNARDAMPDGGELHFATALTDVDDAWAHQHPPMKPGHYVRLAITDTGTGMSPEVQARVFEPFFTTKPQGRGTGFGLATVYGIVKQSGGFIWVSSAPGEGSTFEIYLPAVRGTIAAAVEIPSKPLDSAQGETVLLVEDDAAVRRLAAEVLTQAGYSVLEARDGDEALALMPVDAAPIDLLIADVVMPGLTGRELASRLATVFPNMRVLYTSGYARTTTVSVGIEPNAPFLAKPFLPSDLLRKVRDVLEDASGVPG